MLNTLVAIAVTFGVLALLVPLGLCYLLARQVAPIRPLRMMLLVMGLTLVGGAVGLGPVGLGLGLLLAATLQRRWRTAALQGAPGSRVPSGLGRHWAAHVADANAARDRFVRVLDDLQPGPLRDSLRAATAEVDDAVAEVRRLAEQGSRTDRAHRDVLAALDAQRRRRHRAPTLAADLEHAMQDATRAQHESAERLAAAARRDMSQVQLLVARLHELTAHALELTTTPKAAALPAELSIADRLGALRLATEEVEQVTRL